MWLILIKYRVRIAYLLAVLLLGWAYGWGYRAAQNRCRADIAQIQHRHSEQRLRMEQQHRAAEQRWQQQAQIQTAELLKARQAIDRQTEQLKQGNHNAIQQDNTAGNYNGIGTHSLRQYNRAFGYAD